MGARICFTNHIHIAEKSFDNGLIKEIGYKDVTPEIIEEIGQDDRIKMIQISSRLPKKAYGVIDRILERRPDLYLRIFSVGTTCETFDLSVLGQMPHLTKVWLEAYLRYHKEAVNPEYLCELPNLRGLHLNLFDCKWLLQYENLRTLYLGKKAKKNLDFISLLSNLKKLKRIQLDNVPVDKDMLDMSVRKLLYP